MRVKLAKTAGFCMGVRRAMEMVLAEANRGQGPIYTFGPLIHNRQVMELLESKGVKAVEEVSGLEKGCLVIRAHGVGPEVRRALKETGLRLIDATCPKVVRVQSLVRFHTRKGCTAVILGDPDHAEVIGIVGHSEGPCHVVKDLDEAAALPMLKMPILVAQTTQNRELFDKVAALLQERYPDALIFDTICDATSNRQAEVRSFAGSVDCLVVVGGFHSGNSRRLAEVAADAGIPVRHVETERDLKASDFEGMEVVGLTAGASTPNWMIRSVAKTLEGIRGKRESRFWGMLRSLSRFLLFSNIFVSGGASFFCFAASVSVGFKPGIVFPAIAFFYVNAMHALNILLDKGASVYNDPERAGFISVHRTFLICMGVSSVAAGLLLSLLQGTRTFFFAALLSVLGILYGIPLVPSKRNGRRRFLRIKDIPGSRTFAEAFGMLGVTTALPAVETTLSPSLSVLLGGAAVFLIAIGRAGLFETFRVQGDLIVGTESLPISLGERRTLTLLKSALALSAAAALGGGLLRETWALPAIMITPALALWLCIKAYEKRWLYPGITFEILADTPFYMPGILALILGAQ